MAKPWLGKVGALFHYMHSLPMDMKRGCIGILIHPPAFIYSRCLNFLEKKFKQAHVRDGFICYFPTILNDVGRVDALL